MTQPTIKEKIELSIAGIPRKKRNIAEACADKVQQEIQEVLNQKKKLNWEEANVILIKNLRDFARLICEEMTATFTGEYKKDEVSYSGTGDWRPTATVLLEQKAQEILKSLE